MQAISRSTHVDHLRDQARRLPETPGVYFWKDARGQTLYIGKAVNLRARVYSYFSNAKRDRRIRDLLKQARALEFEVTTTELEALFRESALIKRELPRFNRSLKTPAQQYFLRFDRSIEHPYMQISRMGPDDESLSFGPFPSGASLRETVEYLHAVLPLRKCTAQKPRCKPCVYYQMGKCAAPFLGEEYEMRHESAIRRLFELLDGREDKVTSWLIEKRDRLSENLLFERAAEVQNRIDTLQKLNSKRTLLSAAIHCRCVLIMHRPDRTGEARVLLVVKGNVIGVRSADSVDADQLARWVMAHLHIAKAVERVQSDLDSTLVLHKWLGSSRGETRWSAIALDAEGDDVAQCVSYVLSGVSATLEPAHSPQRLCAGE